MLQASLSACGGAELQPPQKHRWVSAGGAPKARRVMWSFSSFFSSFFPFFFLLLLSLTPTPAHAQTTSPAQWQMNTWQRNCASLDMDFYNDRYYINNNTTCDGTTGTFYTAGSGNTGVQNFITGTGATFTRSGTNNVTDSSPPFYIDTTQGQAFVSRASVTNNVTAYTTPFYLNNSQAFVSRSSVTNNVTATSTFYTGSSQSWVSRASSATYFDSTGTLQTAASGTARNATYSYNSSSGTWVANSGTLIEQASTNSIRNNTMVGAVAADGVERTNNGTFSTTSPNVCSGMDSSLGNGMSCSTGTAVTAQTISSITYSGTTATLTTASAHGLSVGAMVNISGAMPSNYTGNYMVTSVPSSTTFTYTMITAPTANATVTLATYTATTGGWAGTVNGGTGSVMGASGSMTLTGDGTHAASMYQAITTISGYTYTIAVTNGAGNAVTVQAGTSVGGTALVSVTSQAASTTTYYQFIATGTTSYIQINNTSATSASVTTVSVQSAGKLPTNWTTLTGFSSNACNYSVIATGVVNGISYIDVNISGTPTTSQVLFDTESSTSTSASFGQVWTASTFLALSGGSLTNVSYAAVGIQEIGGGIQVGFGSVPFQISSLLTEYSYSRTLATSNTSYIRSAFGIDTTAGKSVNITLRVGMPQLELGSTATSVIATSGTAVTRAADVYNQQTASYFDSTGTLQTAAANVARVTYDPAVIKTISSITRSGTGNLTATVTTASAHGLTVGQTVTMTGQSPSTYAGTFNIASVPSTTTFTYTLPSDPGGSATTVGNYGLNLIEPASTNSLRNNTMQGAVASVALTAQTISSITDSSGTATVTTSAAHGLSVGNIVTVSGASPSNYNGTFKIISVPSATTFTYSMASDPAANATTVGSYTAKTAGTLPTNWSNNSYLTATVVGTGTVNNISYVDIRFAGTGNFTNGQTFQLDTNTGIAASSGQTLVTSAYIACTSDPSPPDGNSVSVNARPMTGGNNYSLNSASAASSSWTLNTSTVLSANRLSGSATIFDSAISSIQDRIIFFITAGNSYDFTLRIGMPQVELYSSYVTSSPTSVIPTYGAAATRSADIYNQQPASYFDSTGTLYFSPYNTARTNYVYSGGSWVGGGSLTTPATTNTLIEPAATNSIRNNMMVGAVAADGVERTNNGTFSATSPNVCSGSDTSSSLALSCSSGNSVGAQTISSITYSGSTATVTTASAHSLGVGYIVNVSGASPSNYNGAFMVTSVPSTTTFTYTMASAPSSNATVTGASYTATAYGWAGTVNGGSGSVTGASGSMTLTGDGTNAASMYEAIPVTSLSSLDFIITTGSGGPVTIQFGSTVGGSDILSAQTVAASTTVKFTVYTNGSTNYIQINNSSATAATVTSVSVQSGGKSPTDWANLNNVAPGLSGSVIATGTINGMRYEDIKVTGTTANANLAINQSFETSTQIAAASGQTWTETCYIALISGTIPNYINLTIQEANSSGSAVQYDSSNSITLSSTLTRYTYTKTLANASTAYVQPALWVGTTGTGQTVNFTIRVAMPQMEQSSYATSAIPTFGSAVTRTADVYSVASGGTYFNSAGVLKNAPANTPRLDHNPASPYLPEGILIEESRQNLVAYSIGTSGVSATGSYTASSVLAPDNTTYFNKCTEGTTTGNQVCRWNNITMSASTTYTVSAYVKANSVSTFLFLANDGNGNTQDAFVNLNTGTISNCYNQLSGSQGIQSLGNGTYRVWITFTLGSSPSSPYFDFRLLNTTSQTCSSGFTGDGASNMYIWGVQLEAGAFPTSYIPTSGSTVTRAADVFTVPTTAAGTYTGTWYHAGQGTLGAAGMMTYAASNASNVPRFAGLSDGTSNNEIILFSSNSSLEQVIIKSGGTNSFLPTFSTTPTTLVKGAVAYESGDAGGAFAGTTSTASSGVVVPTVSELDIGNTGGVFQTDGWLNRIWYIPTRQTNASLKGYTQ